MENQPALPILNAPHSTSQQATRPARNPRFRNRKTPFAGNPTTNKDHVDPKPRPNQPSGKINYSEKSVPATLSTRVLKYYHPIHTATTGIDSYARIIYNTYSFRDKRLETAFPVELLSYVSTLALQYRIYTIGATIGYALRKPSYYSKLESLSENLTLPEPIAKYIESIGPVQIATGICLVPHVPTEPQLIENADYANIEALVSGLPDYDAPVVPAARRVLRSKTFLSTPLVGRYMMGAVIGAKFNNLFRKVDLTSHNGSVVFISAYSESNGGLIGHSPQEMEAAQCQLGACYRLRNIDERISWLGTNDDYRLVQNTAPFDETIFIIDKVMNHMTARN
jgi:hypothetical protein